MRRATSPRSLSATTIEPARLIVEALGRKRLVIDLRSADFEELRSQLALTRGAVSLRDIVNRIRSVFNYAHDAHLIDGPVQFGTGFSRPSRNRIRAERDVRGQRMFESREIQTILDAANDSIRCMTLLGINCAFGQSDISNLSINAIESDRSYVNFPRPRTAIPRRCPLWPETRYAIERVINNRAMPAHEDDADMLFLTKSGHRWVRISNGAAKAWTDSVGLEFGKLLRRLGLKQPGINFYALRHTFETIAGDSRDQIALDHVMGHVGDDMASVYRERISDQRLIDVCNHVRDWLFGD